MISCKVDWLELPRLELAEGGEEDTAVAMALLPLESVEEAADWDVDVGVSPVK